MGFEGEKCESLDSVPGAQTCAIRLHFNPDKTFHAVFYTWTRADMFGDRVFATVVGNAQPTPDRAKPESAMKLLVSRIEPAPRE